jgi:Cu(I)/Ag(I) efflux system membrane protein CusA/SilA
MLIECFDGDHNGKLSIDELYLAANFSGVDLAKLRSTQDWFLRYELMAVPGVSEVASVGGFVRQYQVEVDPEKMRAYGLTLAKVKRAIQRSNSDAGGRLIEMGETEFMVRARGYFERLEDLQIVPVGMDPNTHTPIYLRQVADVHLGPELRRGVIELNGEGEAVSGIVVMRFGENALEVIERVKQRLESLRSGLPPGVEVHTSYDRSELINSAIDNLTGKIVMELIVVALVCLLFLLHLRSAFVAVITIPMGVLFSFMVMHWMGINANIMSLGGIAIAIGVMVDGAVVMVENLHKHLEHPQGKTHIELVTKAAQEVAPSLFFSLLVITVSFLPVFTLEQQEGRLFTPLAYTKTFAMAGSALIAVTITPALLYYFVRGRIRPEQQNPTSRFFIRIYRPVIDAILRYPKRTIVVTGVLSLLTFYPLAELGSEFMPPLNEGDILYMPTTPPGISITKAKEVLQQTNKLLRKHPLVAHVHGKIGRAETSTDPAPLSMIETTIMLTDKVTWPSGTTIESIMRELDQMVQFPGLTNAWTMPIKTRIDMLATGIKTPVGIKLMGADLAQLSKVGQTIEAHLRNLPGTASVFSERAVGGNYVDIRVKRQAAARFGLTVTDVQDIVHSAIGGMNVTWTVEGLERYPVNVRYPRELRNNISQLQRIAVPTPMGHTVPLGSVATIEVAKGPPVIKSENSKPTSWIYVDIESDDVGGYVKRAKEHIRQGVSLPEGVSMIWSGQFEYMERAEARLLVVVPLTLAIIFLLLFIHFRNITETAIVMGTLPLALMGGVWLMWALDFNTSVAAAVGFIALAGLSAETGVVMLVYLDLAYNRRREAGTLTSVTHLREVIIEGAVERVRPKLMTVATTLAGLIPVMLGSDTGARIMKRIAAPMVGGMISSTGLTLVVIPIVYFLWKRAGLHSAQEVVEQEK